MKTQSSTAPFTLTFTPQLPELFLKLNITLALTTYQAGKVVFLSPNTDGEGMTSLPRNFKKPMGMCLKGDTLVIATKDTVEVLENSKHLAVHYPNKQNTYDSLFVPRITFHTGRVDMHDIAIGGDGIYAVNTSFSCISKVDGNYNFKPIWQPPFIDQLSSEDRCHLNGLVMQDGKPKYVTGLGKTNTASGWRETIVDGGFMMDVTTNEMILEGLAMPHSPHLHKDEIYFLQSASGTFSKYNPKTKALSTIKQFDGFCRGLSIYEDYAFIGFSKLRKNSSTFAKLDFSDKADFAGIKVIHIPTGAEVGAMTYKMSVDEIYEVTVLPDMIRPNILNTEKEVYKYALAIPGQTFWARPETVEKTN